MKLVDAFLFYNELDMLEYRLTVLDPVVDQFILVESTVTFAGNPKPLVYAENKDRYAKWAHKLTHVVVEDTPDGPSAWDREWFQRNAIDRGLQTLGLKSADILCLADVDEIPNLQVLSMLKKEGLEEALSLEMDLYYYTAELKLHKWVHAKVCPIELYSHKFGRTPERLRMSHQRPIANGGWHLSYFGSPEFVQNKLRNFSHQEYNTEARTSLDFVTTRLATRTNLFDDRVFAVTPLASNPFPPPRLDLLLKFFPV
jgi:hypothetical protein